MTVRPRGNRFWALLTVIFVLGACGGGGSEEQVVVFAAASLTDAFSGMETAFEDANPGVDVEIMVAGSSALREQLLDGAPGDVFASANIQNLTPLIDAGLVTEPHQWFATNSLQIAVPKGNPIGVRGLDDFARENLFIGLCAPAVPCGELARQSLERAGVVPSVDTDEPNVRALAVKIAAGELDAGLVYQTDVIANAGSLDGINMSPEHVITVDYPLARLDEAPNPAGAMLFIDFVLSERGQSIMQQYGFQSVTS
jgi:molybdate transport system substrate-binding protein